MCARAVCDCCAGDERRLWVGVGMAPGPGGDHRHGRSRIDGSAEPPLLLTSRVGLIVRRVTQSSSAP